MIRNERRQQLGEEKIKNKNGMSPAHELQCPALHGTLEFVRGPNPKNVWAGREIFVTTVLTGWVANNSHRPTGGHGHDITYKL